VIRATIEEYDLMVFHRAFPAVLALATTVVLAGCTGSTDAPAPGRAAGDPIVGVASADGPPECVAPVIRRTADVNVLELTVSGEQGDVFGYEVTRKDGSVVDGTTQEFGPGQRDEILTTGVPNADVAKVTVSATGRVGVPGSCVISTIQ
jgi:hypothetical protein